jgi:hypothetical protein
MYKYSELVGAPSLKIGQMSSPYILLQDEWVQPYGYGKRKCLGESVARPDTQSCKETVSRDHDSLSNNLDFELKL